MIVVNRVYDSVAATFVRWSTASPDTGGASYPGPGAFGITVDYCVEAITNSGGVSDHGFLLGLSDDDHTQYPKLTGRSGGQTLIGGVDPGNMLSLRGSSYGAPGDSYITMLDNLNLGNNNIEDVGDFGAVNGLVSDLLEVQGQVLSTVVGGGQEAAIFTATDGKGQHIIKLVSNTTSSGTNGASSNIYVGSVSPVGSVFAPAGSLYIESHSESPTLWIKNSAIGDNTDWYDFRVYGTGLAAGANTELQFNSSGAFGASANLTWNGSVLNVNGNITSSSTISHTATTSISSFSGTSGAGDVSPMVLLNSTNGVEVNGSITKIFVGKRNPNTAPVVGAVTGALYVRGDTAFPANSSLYICTDPVTPYWANLRPSASVLEGSVTTTNNTPATIISFVTTINNTVSRLNFTVQAVQSTTGDAALFDVAALVYRNGSGTLSVKDITFLNGPFSNQPAWNVSLSLSGSTVNVQVTGEAAKTIKWTVHGDAQEA